MLLLMIPFDRYILLFLWMIHLIIITMLAVVITFDQYICLFLWRFYLINISMLAPINISMFVPMLTSFDQYDPLFPSMISLDQYTYVYSWINSIWFMSAHGWLGSIDGFIPLTHAQFSFIVRENSLCLGVGNEETMPLYAVPYHIVDFSNGSVEVFI